MPGSEPVRMLYVTGNEGKHLEVQHIARLLRGDDVQIDRIKVDLPELQGEPEEIAIAKTREAARQLSGKMGKVRFLITDDTGLGLDCLNGFPGVYIKPMLEKLHDSGIGGLVARYEQKGAVATCTLGVIDFEETLNRRRILTAADEPLDVRIFSGECRGNIIAEPRGDVKHGNLSWNTIFVPLGYEPKTFGELQLDEHATMSHRHHAFAAFLDTALP
eukprot:gnl/TRDRNA2_/TRDRNA2_156133_c0_seq1.p1 gnl/TRDRNA2_/TRDRNA2_156133_c0~~gnl/TRDRNA2_/TRDRNA2_156133_c0_seq1.p1  ORF type:complete len:240 (+),score=42.75 gnl/TRDRNA2_/TRDRNA2_156133_c0_seq1:71-721(+)